MEKRLNKKIEQYVSLFKDEIRNKIIEIGFEEKEKINELMGFVYEYNRLTLEKDDFSKRKRLKNSIPVTNRCTAKRANGDQCTRRRRDDSEYCGTHYKSSPHGCVHDFEESPNEDTPEYNTQPTSITETSNYVNDTCFSQRLEVIAEEICGIVYYLDKYGNVYCTEDILHGKDNPTIIAKYTKNGESYSIPELGLG